MAVGGVNNSGENASGDVWIGVDGTVGVCCRGVDGTVGGVAMGETAEE